MKTILVTLIITATAFWIWYDYDNIKQWFSNEEDKSATVIVETREAPAEKEIPRPVQKKPPKIDSKFNEDDIVYVNAMAGDLMGFQNNLVEFWLTYDGSDRDDKQRVVRTIEHRTKCRILDIAKGSNDIIWYRVKTMANFQSSGWVEEKFLSEELPPRRT